MNVRLLSGSCGEPLNDREWTHSRLAGHANGPISSQAKRKRFPVISPSSISARLAVAIEHCRKRVANAAEPIGRQSEGIGSWGTHASWETLMTDLIDNTAALMSASSASASLPPRVTKSAAVIKLLSRNRGASIAEIMTATHWQPHSTRAFLTGLRKKGKVLLKEARKDGESCYRLES